MIDFRKLYSNIQGKISKELKKDEDLGYLFFTPLVTGNCSIKETGKQISHYKEDSSFKNRFNWNKWEYLYDLYISQIYGDKSSSKDYVNEVEKRYALIADNINKTELEDILIYHLAEADDITMAEYNAFYYAYDSSNYGKALLIMMATVIREINGVNEKYAPIYGILEKPHEFLRPEQLLISENTIKLKESDTLCLNKGELAWFCYNNSPVLIYGDSGMGKSHILSDYLAPFYGNNNISCTTINFKTLFAEYTANNIDSAIEKRLYESYIEPYEVILFDGANEMLSVGLDLNNSVVQSIAQFVRNCQKKGKKTIITSVLSGANQYNDAVSSFDIQITIGLKGLEKEYRNIKCNPLFAGLIQKLYGIKKEKTKQQSKLEYEYLLLDKVFEERYSRFLKNNHSWSSKIFLDNLPQIAFNIVLDKKEEIETVPIFDPFLVKEYQKGGNLFSNDVYLFYFAAKYIMSYFNGFLDSNNDIEHVNTDFYQFPFELRSYIVQAILGHSLEADKERHVTFAKLYELSCDFSQREYSLYRKAEFFEIGFEIADSLGDSYWGKQDCIEDFRNITDLYYEDSIKPILEENPELLIEPWIRSLCGKVIKKRPELNRRLKEYENGLENIDIFEKEEKAIFNDETLEIALKHQKIKLKIYSVQELTSNKDVSLKSIQTAFAEELEELKKIADKGYVASLNLLGRIVAYPTHNVAVMKNGFVPDYVEGFKVYYNLVDKLLLKTAKPTPLEAYACGECAAMLLYNRVTVLFERSSGSIPYLAKLNVVEGDMSMAGKDNLWLAEKLLELAGAQNSYRKFLFAVDIYLKSINHKYRENRIKIANKWLKMALKENKNNMVAIILNNIICMPENPTLDQKHLLWESIRGCINLSVSDYFDITPEEYHPLYVLLDIKYLMSLEHGDLLPTYQSYVKELFGKYSRYIKSNNDSAKILKDEMNFAKNNHLI